MSVSSGNQSGDITVKISDASISAYRIVYGDTTDTTNTDMVMLAATGETTKPLGVTLEATTAADQNCAVRVSGIAKIEVNGTSAIDIGDSICASTAGVGVISSTADNVAQWAIGFALAPSAASGDVIEVLIDRHMIVKGAS